MVRHDGGRPRHDRHPVGIGHLGDQDRVVLEAVDLGRGVELAHLPGRHRVADAEPAHEPLAFALDRVRLERPGLPAGLDRLGTGLHDIKVAGRAVLGPLHVHRPPVVLLDGDSPAGQLQDLRIVEHVCRALAARRADHPRPWRARRGVDRLLELLSEGLVDDRHEPRLFQERLEDDVLVRIDGALDDRLAEAPGGVDEHHARKACLGVDGEHHPGRGSVGSDHSLHADRDRHPQVIESVGLPIHDRPVGEQRGEAATTRLQQRLLSPDVEETLELAGKAGSREILGRRATPDRDIEACPAGLETQFAIGARDRAGDGGRQIAVQKLCANGLADLGQ